MKKLVHSHDGKLIAIKRDRPLMPEHHRWISNALCEGKGTRFNLRFYDTRKRQMHRDEGQISGCQGPRVGGGFDPQRAAWGNRGGSGHPVWWLKWRLHDCAFVKAQRTVYHKKRMLQSVHWKINKTHGEVASQLMTPCANPECLRILLRASSGKWGYFMGCYMD